MKQHISFGNDKEILSSKAQLAAIERVRPLKVIIKFEAYSCLRMLC